MARASAPVVEAELHAYVDGQLAGDRHNDVLAYLQANPQARARVEGWRHQNDCLIAAFEPVLREALPVSLSLRVSSASAYSATPAVGAARSGAANYPSAEPARFIPSEQPVRSSHLMLAFLFGLATAFAIAGAAFLVLETRHLQAAANRGEIAAPVENVLTRLSRRTLEAHRAFAAEKARSFELGNSRPGQLRRSLAQLAGWMVDIPDLSTEGLTLAGGRIIPGEDGPDVLLVYETAAGERLSLVLANPANTAATRVTGQNPLVEQSGTVASAAASFNSRLFGFSFAGSHDQTGRILRLIQSQLPPAK